MTRARELPFSRPVEVARLDPKGQLFELQATDAERAALAAEWALPAISRLAAQLTVTPARNGMVDVTGALEAQVTQTCVVTLDPFDTDIQSPVEVTFAPEEKAAALKAVSDRDPDAPDPPDPIENGRIDLGRLAAEFLALELDPYPRKPGAAFEWKDEDMSASPFAGLAHLRPRGES